AGVGPAVSVEDCLVVLSRNEGSHPLAVGEGEEGGFLPLEVLLHYDAAAGGPELTLDEHLPQGGLRLFVAFGHDDALAGGQPVRLDDGRAGERTSIGEGGLELAEGAVLPGGNAVALHEGLGE